MVDYDGFVESILWSKVQFKDIILASDIRTEAVFDHLRSHDWRFDMEHEGWSRWSKPVGDGIAMCFVHEGYADYGRHMLHTIEDISAGDHLPPLVLVKKLLEGSVRYEVDSERSRYNRGHRSSQVD